VSVSLAVLSVVLALTASYILSSVASGFAAEAGADTFAILSALLPPGLERVATTWGRSERTDRFALAPCALATSIMTILVVVTMAKQWGSYALVVGSSVEATD